MRVELKNLKPFSLRDQRIDPIEEESVQMLAHSIREHGFWSGAVGRYGANGEIELIAGATRVAGALTAGVTHADIHVGKYSDAKALQIYMTENFTQRGGELLSAAAAGAVASGIRFLLKGILTGDKDVCRILQTSDKGLEIIRGQIASDKGLGRECILKLYPDNKRFNKYLVENQLSNLKASGEYARIVEEVNEEVAQEEADERAELEQREAAEAEAKKAAEEAERRAREIPTAAAQKEAEEAKAKAHDAEQKVQEKAKVKSTRDTSKKAVARAKNHPVTFDREGVSKFLKTEHQVRVFRKAVERKDFGKHIPVGAQAKLAAILVKYANKHNKGKLTASFIATYLTEIVKNADLRKGGDLDLEVTDAAIRSIEYESAKHKFSDLSHHFCRNWAGVINDANDMIRLKDEYPDLSFNITQELRIAVRFATSTINKLIEKLNIKTP